MVNKAVGATIDKLDVGSTVNSFSMSDLVDGIPNTNAFTWSNVNAADHLRVTLSSPTYIGSVIFVVVLGGNANPGGSNAGEGYLYAGSDPTDVSACKICNDGNLISTHGVVNCLAPWS